MLKIKESVKKTALLLAVVMLAGCSNINNPTVDITDSSQPAEQTSATEITTTEITEPPVTEPPAPVTKTVSFCAVGDNLIHDAIYNQARTDDGGYDFTAAYKNIAKDIESADVAVINQETLICNDVWQPSSYPCFNSPVALGDHMMKIGFDVFTIANNHSLDYGEKGLQYALEYWESRNAATAGAYHNQEDKDSITVKEYGGLNFSFLSYTQYTNGLTLPQGSEMILGDVNDLDGMIADVKAAKQISDVCVVALHWGIENADAIEDWQRQWAKALADAGADIIIGNHPHVLRGIEMIDREDGGQTLCAYSLGNFISAQRIPQNLIGGILNFNVSLTEGDKYAKITDVKLTPIVTHYDYSYTNLRIEKLSDYTPEMADSHGVRNYYSYFSYDYIVGVLQNNISEEYLVLPEAPTT